jgi:hypothetical protein
VAVKRETVFIKRPYNLPAGLFLVCEKIKYSTDGPYFMFIAGYQNNAVSLQTLTFSGTEDLLHFAFFVQQQPVKTIGGAASNPEALLREPALARKNFHRQLPAIFARHGSF